MFDKVVFLDTYIYLKVVYKTLKSLEFQITIKNKVAFIKINI